MIKRSRTEVYLGHETSLGIVSLLDNECNEHTYSRSQSSMLYL